MADSQQTSSANSSSSSLPKAPPELSSILSQVQTLQSDRERLQKELEEARQKMDKLQVFIPFPLHVDPSRLLHLVLRRRVSVRR
jgi:peptidoglycan hydrolase CwlO-like protein